MVWVLLFYGCQGGAHPPAPLGERVALEKLAQAYEDLSKQLPVSPSGLTPKGKLKFVREVFDKAGYDLNKTIQALTNTSPDQLTPYHKDMMELVLLPNQGLSEQALGDLYNETELNSMTKIAALYAR